MPSIESMYPNSPHGKPNYGNRPDGTPKGMGYFGELPLPNGGVATEYTTQSNAVKVNGQRIDFPTLVPGLSKAQVEALVTDIIPNQKPIPEPIMQKAINHAKQRLAAGKSVFADEGEQRPPPGMTMLGQPKMPANPAPTGGR